MSRRKLFNILVLFRLNNLLSTILFFLSLYTSSLSQLLMSIGVVRVVVILASSMTTVLASSSSTRSCSTPRSCCRLTTRCSLLLNFLPSSFSRFPTFYHRYQTHSSRFRHVVSVLFFFFLAHFPYYFLSHQQQSLCNI